MLLQRMDLGIGSDSIINCNHEFAADLYSANKNLKTLCATLCDKDFIRRRRQLLAEERDEVDNHNRYGTTAIIAYSFILIDALF